MVGRSLPFCGFDFCGCVHSCPLCTVQFMVFNFIRKLNISENHESWMSWKFPTIQQWYHGDYPVHMTSWISRSKHQHQWYKYHVMCVTNHAYWSAIPIIKLDLSRLRIMHPCNWYSLYWHDITSHDHIVLYYCMLIRVLLAINLRPSTLWVGMIWAEFMTTSIILVTTSKK